MSKNKLSYEDRVLPVQPEQAKLFADDTQQLIPTLYEAISQACGFASPHEELSLELTDLHSIEEMASPPLNLRLLQFLISSTAPKRVLEIGTFIGVSTIYMAKALPPGGTITTIEKFDHFAEICAQNFSLNNVADRIELVHGDAMEVLDRIPVEEPYDFAFIDGDKGRYASYFEKVDRLIKPGGIVVVDDVFFHGDALNNQPVTEKGAGVREFLALMSTRQDYQRLILPLSNGVFIGKKTEML